MTRPEKISVFFLINQSGKLSVYQIGFFQVYWAQQIVINQSGKLQINSLGKWLSKLWLNYLSKFRVFFKFT